MRTVCVPAILKDLQTNTIQFGDADKTSFNLICYKCHKVKFNLATEGRSNQLKQTSESRPDWDTILGRVQRRPSYAPKYI